jgi:hypothetical protein
MGTIYFLTFIGVCAFVVVWATRRSSTAHNLEKRPYSKQTGQLSEKLTPVSHDRLSHKEEIWEARRNQAKKGFSSPKRFVPKSAASAEPEYDGYSRRDRHHVSTAGQVAEETHIEKISTTL